MAAQRVAFIGLGRMGAPMAANLARAGFDVAGFDVSAQAGATLAGTPRFVRVSTAAQAVRDARAVILMLPDSAAVDALLWDAAGIASALARGCTVLDMGSSDPLHTRDNAARLAAAGVTLLDAPVSGGVKRAADASLTIMAGGPADAFEQARPLLQALGKTLFHVGAAGAGHAVKALNNYVSAAGLIAVSEALVAAAKFGIDPHTVNAVINASTGRNNTTDVKVEAFMLSQRYDSGFALALMKKDVATAAAFIEGVGAPGAFARNTLSLATQALQALGDDADHTALHAWLARKS